MQINLHEMKDCMKFIFHDMLTKQAGAELGQAQLSYILAL